MDMKKKIQDILSNNLKNYTNDQQQDIIQRLAIIGLRTLQLEQKEPLQIEFIHNISNQIVEKMDESGNLRKELSSIKEQLSKLSNKFEILSSEKKQNTDPSLNYSSNLSTSHNNSVVKTGSQIPPQPPTAKQNLQLQKENRQNQFLSQQRLLSLPNSTSNKALNTPQSSQKNLSNSQTRSSSQHKLFETDENSLVRAKNLTKKPSSDWRSGDRSNSVNNGAAEECQRSNSEEGNNMILSNLNNSESTEIQRRRLIKNTDVAPKITETIPSSVRQSSVKSTTRHHLDDKHIKEALFCMENDPIQKVDKKETLDSERQSSIQRKKWDSKQQQQQSSDQQEQINRNLQRRNSKENPIHEYVSLSSNQQFLPTPNLPTQAQIQSFQNFNSVGAIQQQQSQQNANFTSPKFKDGRENSINTQFNTTEQKKGGQYQSVSYNQNQQQVIHIQNQSQQYNSIEYQQNQQRQYHSQNQQFQQQQQFQEQQPFKQQEQQQQMKKGNNNVQQNQPQQQKEQPQTKYATTKSLQKKLEINKQKKQEELLKQQNQQTQKKQQPAYLKGVTSRIKEEIRQKKESLKGEFNHDVEFVIKEKGKNHAQTRVVKGSELAQDEIRQQYQQQDYGYQYTQEEQEDEYDNYYNQQPNNMYNQNQKNNGYYENYQSNGNENNYDQDENEQSYKNNFAQRRNEHKLMKQNSNQNQQQQSLLGSGQKISAEIPPVPNIDESYSDFRNNCAQSQNQEQLYQFMRNDGMDDDYSNFDQKSSYTPSNYEDIMKNNNNNYNFNQNKSNLNDENFNHMNIPNYNQNDKSTSNIGEQNSFNYRYNDQSSFYSNNTKINYDQQSHNNVNNITSNSQNLSTIANNMMQSPIINHFSNLKQNKKDQSITDQDQLQARNKKHTSNKPIFSEQSNFPYSNNQPHHNGFDQFNDSYQNASSIQQSLNDISYKKTISNPPFQKNEPPNLDQSSMAQDNYDQQNRSVNSSLSSFQLDNNMREVLQKDKTLFQKMFENEDQFSHQKFDNTFTSHHHQSNNNYANMMSSKSHTRQLADYNNSSINKMRDDSMMENNFNNPTRYSQIQQKMDYNQPKNDFQFGDDDEEDNGVMMDRRLCNFFAEQQS